MSVLFIIAWAFVTYVIFNYMRKNTTVVSFNGCMGFLQAYMELLMEAGIIALLVVAIPFWILESIGKYLIGALVIGGIIYLIVNNNKDNNEQSTSITSEGNKQLNSSANNNNNTPVEKAFCGNCGAKLDPGSTFCGNCGSKV